MNTNMDLRRPSNADGPQLEFTLPLNEIDESLEVGQRGEVTIPVEITEVGQTHVSFRKVGKASSPMSFKDESLSAMEARINEDSEDSEDDSEE